jgi:hypothetical protein
MVKRIVLNVTKVITGIAALFFVLSPVFTRTGLLLFAASIVVMLVCFAVSSNLDEKAHTGYWPEPLDWSARGGSPDAVEKLSATQQARRL